MGDACHPTTPHMGQGAGMSFEDAVVLSRCFDEMQQHKHTDVFHSFERTRFDRTGRIQFESHENKWTKSGMDSDWVYGYDAFTTPLK
jgi:salicylate hydroxylase/6-hydroxynicotinate 3-monooxygenase